MKIKRFNEINESKAPTADEVKDMLSVGDAHFDQVTKRGTTYTARRGYYYRHGQTAQGFVNKVLDAIPGVKIIDSGDIWKPFKGGASLAQQSHFYVTFELPTMNESRKIFNVGAKVQVSDGSGLKSNKIGVVVSPRMVKTDRDGVPKNVTGAYKPVDWSREVAVQLEDGELITMFKTRLSLI